MDRRHSSSAAHRVVVFVIYVPSAHLHPFDEVERTLAAQIGLDKIRGPWALTRLLRREFDVPQIQVRLETPADTILVAAMGVAFEDTLLSTTPRACDLSYHLVESRDMSFNSFGFSRHGRLRVKL